MLQINIKKYRETLGISQYKLAGLMGLRQSTVGMWESGKSSPGYSNLVKLAEILGVTVSALTGEIEGVQTKQAVRVPVYGVIPAGIPMEAIEGIIDYEEIPAEMTAGGKEYFALKIRGNSMSPDYLEDDVVIYQRAVTCDSGDECAVIVNGEEATFKKVVIHKSGIFLQPLNVAEHEPTYYSNREVEELPVRVIGIAKELRRKK